MAVCSDHVVNGAPFAAEDPHSDVQLADDVSERVCRGRGQRIGAAGLRGVQDGEPSIDNGHLLGRAFGTVAAAGDRP